MSTIAAEAGLQDVFNAARAVGKCERDAQGRQAGIQVAEMCPGAAALDLARASATYPAPRSGCSAQLAACAASASESGPCPGSHRASSTARARVQRVALSGTDHRGCLVRAGISRQQVSEELCDLGVGKRGQPQPGHPGSVLKLGEPLRTARTPGSPRPAARTHRCAASSSLPVGGSGALGATAPDCGA